MSTPLAASTMPIALPVPSAATAVLAPRAVRRRRAIAAVIIATPLLAGAWLVRAFVRQPPQRHARVRSWFLRGLGGVYLAAFSSLRAQVRGLFGARGIAPVAPMLAHAREEVGPRRWLEVPTLFWRDASDDALDRTCLRGQWLAVGLIFGVYPRVTAALLWAHYLSFVTVGSEFLGYQWDVLLLEVGLHAVVVAPWTRRGLRRSPTPMDVLLMRWLAFRLHFESGLVKRRSPDRAWRDRTAMSHYYETAPLPTRLGWYAHHLPPAVQRFSTQAAVAIECGAPFLAFGPRPLRLVAWAATTGLQALIAVTGNYGFFNALTILLNTWMLDDGALGVRPRRLARRAHPAQWPISLGVGGLLFVVSIDSLRSFVDRRIGLRFTRPARVLLPIARALAPFHAVNAYGPFSVMTRERPEITLEGSDDGLVWKELPFRYKMSALDRPPRWVAPHQPRLDWQMWFAALRSAPPRWFVVFMLRVLEGSPDVMALLEPTPFGARSPRYLRATLHRYRATTLRERRRTGAWWRRERIGTYVPPLGLP